MKKLPFLYALVAGASLYFSTGTAFAYSKATSGVIHFHGQVVEGACNVLTQPAELTVSCLRSGVRKTQSMTLDDVDRVALSQDIVTITKHEVDRHPELYLLVVNYI
ncbi:TPA: hypothetical protein ACIPUI_002863 [Citrobacter freundii]